MSGTVHHYRTRLEWSGSTGAGWEGYDRTHRLWAVAEGGAVPAAGDLATVNAATGGGLTLSSDPTFLGDPALLNPEQLLVAAAQSCHFLSFLAVAARKRLDVVSYVDEAVGAMPEDAKPMIVSSIVLHPHVVVAPNAEGELPSDEIIVKAHDTAHHICFIANSIRTEITVEPTVEHRR